MAFTFAAFSYIIALIVDAFLIFFAIFHLVLPEYGLHILFNVLFLCAGEWFSLFLNLPLIAYHINRYRSRPVMSGPGLYDPTSIMNHEVLSQCQREGWIKLAFYLMAFFYYLYGMIVSLISAS